MHSTECGQYLSSQTNRIHSVSANLSVPRASALSFLFLFLPAVTSLRLFAIISSRAKKKPASSPMQITILDLSAYLGLTAVGAITINMLLGVLMAFRYS